jgi:hypothetical protein
MGSGSRHITQNMEEAMFVAMKAYDEDEQRYIDEVCHANDSCETCPLNIECAETRCW